MKLPSFLTYSGALLVSSVLLLPVASAATLPDSVLPVPEGILSGSTVNLKCGKTYSGTLDLIGLSNVTVKTEGSCGKAAISPGHSVQGWKKVKGNIYAAPLTFTPAVVSVDGTMQELAHYPNRPQVWAKGKSNNPYQIRHAMPNADLTDAQLVYRANDWLIDKRPIKNYAKGVLTMLPREGEHFAPPEDTEFYVEGKLWMLDSPGEWAVSQGLLFVWAHDGRSPEGRVWASPDAPAIDASRSHDVTIDGIKTFDATHGIRGGESSNLKIVNVEVRNSNEDGIFAGGTGLTVHNSTIVDSVQNGIFGYYGIKDSVVSNNTITNSGMVGMPKRSKGAIVFEDASGQRVVNNLISHSSYIGIRVYRNAVVQNNLIDGACLILTDCGGIYTFARDKQPLNVRIEGNTIRNLAQRQAYAVYLDDYANGVTVTRNRLSNNPGGLEIHNGFNNEITHNVFADSAHEHVLFNETGPQPSIQQNRFAHNIFISTSNVPTYRLWSAHEDKGVKRFATYQANAYTGADKDFADVAGVGMVTYSKWKARMDQDQDSVLKAPGKASLKLKTTLNEEAARLKAGSKS